MALAPRAFEGSGAANCCTGGGFVGVEASSQPLGTLDGMQVSLDLTWYGDGSSTGPGPAPVTSVSVSFKPTTATDRPEPFTTISGTVSWDCE